MPSSGVAHVFNRMEPGGAELRTIEVVSRFRKAFAFFAVSGQSGRLDADLRAAGHEVFLERLSLGTLPRYVSLFRGNYRVVHSHLGGASGAVVLAAWMARIPKRIVHFRSDAIGGGNSLKKSVYLALSRILIKWLATDLIGVSAGSLEHAWDPAWRNDPRCEVIPNGFDVSRLRSQARTSAEAGDHFVVANVGRPDPVKNRGRAIAIWRQVASRLPSSLLLIGALNPGDEALARAADNEFGGVEIVGDTTKVAEYLGKSKVLLMTSQREGLPGVVLEALCVGVPVVATDLPGTRWIASAVQGMTLLPLTQTDSAWADAIIRAAVTDSASIMASFDASPFTLDEAARRFSTLWEVAP